MGQLTRAVAAGSLPGPDAFDQAVRKMPELLRELVSSDFVERGCSTLPKSGVYVFYENGKPIYVGRSKRLRQRLNEHCQPSAGHTSATFAFMLAKADAERKGLILPKKRQECQEMPEFARLYACARRLVAEMQIKVVEVADDVEQTLFEVYAALALATPHNSWETH